MDEVTRHHGEGLQGDGPPTKVRELKQELRRSKPLEESIRQYQHEKVLVTPL